MEEFTQGVRPLLTDSDRLRMLTAGARPDTPPG